MSESLRVGVSRSSAEGTYLRAIQVGQASEIRVVVGEEGAYISVDVGPAGHWDPDNLPC